MVIPENAKEINCYYTWMGEDGIARTKVKSGSEVNLADAQENSIAVNSLFESKKFPLIIDSRGIKSMTREARSHFQLKADPPMLLLLPLSWVHPSAR